MTLSLGTALTPALLELNRAGRLVVASTSIATNGRAPVQDFPTTTANWCLQNPVSNDRHLVLMRAGFWLSGGTADKGSTLIAGVTPTALTSSNVLTSNATGHTVGNLRGRPVGGNGPFLGVNVTVPSVAAQMAIVGGMENAANATIGSGASFDVGGMLICPPGHGIVVDVVSGAGTNPKFGIFLLLASLPLDLEGS